jgi:hypothetical protein
MAKLHYTNKLANLLCNITNELVGLNGKTIAPNKLYNLLGAGLARAQHHDIAIAHQVGQQVGSVEFISQQVVQTSSCLVHQT